MIVYSINHRPRPQKQLNDLKRFICKTLFKSGTNTLKSIFIYFIERCRIIIRLGLNNQQENSKSATRQSCHDSRRIHSQAGNTATPAGISGYGNRDSNVKMKDLASGNSVRASCSARNSLARVFGSSNETHT